MAAETILRTWFTNSIQPSKTILWVSAVTPDTFQSNPRILEELLKRPLEIPDAMGQQRATARYSACLIARAISEMTPNPSQLISFLQELNFFQNPDILLHKPFPDSLQTHIKKLIREGFDPATFWQYELRSLSQHFHEGLHILRTLFKVRRPQKHTPNLTSFFVNEHEWWGTNYFHDSNIVNIHPSFLFLPAVSKSLVLRDAVRIFLPTSFQNALDVQEFANVLVTDLLDSTERQVWNQIKWNGTQPTPEQQEWISTMIALTPDLIEKGRLPALYKRLKRIDSLVDRVPTGSFTIIAQQELFEIKPRPAITGPQEKILLTLAKDPLASERQIATATKLARGTVNRNLLTLQEQFGITVPGEINYRKIGLSPLLLTVSSLTSTATGSTKLFELSQQLRTFPYCFRLHAPQSPASTTLYAIIALPERIIPDFLNLLDKWKKDTQLSTQLHRISQYEWGWDFAYWTGFLPVEWKILASSSLRPESSESNFTNSIQYEDPVIKLTREALRVLLILQNDMRVSQRQLAKDAQTSVTTAANHYNRLIPDVITPYTGFTHPPLPEGTLLTVDASVTDNANELLAGIRLLPGFQIWHLAQSSTQEPSSVLITVNLPEGGLVPFLAAFEEVSSFYEVIPSLPQIVSHQLPHVHGLPLALFKTVGQEWMCSSSLLESLFHP
ncbi:MAG: winged helix-turn-helix domain-containing protein [Candidatus Hermodarchaeia archaeon]